MIPSLLNTAIEILGLLAILSAVVSIVAAAMLSSRINRQQEDSMPDENNPVTQYKRRVEIFNAIRRERAYQDRKYGTIAQRNMPLDDYLVIASDELTESAISFRSGDIDNARCELLQVAAVAIAALEAHGLIERTDLNTNDGA